MAGSRKFENVGDGHHVTGRAARPHHRPGRFFRVDEDRGEPVACDRRRYRGCALPIRGSHWAADPPLGRRFTVIGIQERQGQSGGVSLDKYVWIPLLAFERAFGAPRTVQIFAKAADDRPSVVGEDRARISLRARRTLEPGEPDNFDILTPDAARSFVANLSERIGAAAGPISLMALLAAIVVVTNTVLVSVTQRTREIGLRRAVGARRTQIMREVLAESLLMAAVGGLAGSATAVTLVAVLARALDLPLVVEPATVFVSVAASALSGLAAGWYPARRAVHLDAVTAMRTE
jgi:putative ABC transport system permease protein